MQIFSRRPGAKLAEPLVTIAVPSFNQGRFLDQALTSIFRQNDVPVEVFVMDGGSTDQSLDVIRHWQSELAGFRSHKDSGQAAAINEAVARGSAKYVCWLNSDDWFLPAVCQNSCRPRRTIPTLRWSMVAVSIILTRTRRRRKSGSSRFPSSAWRCAASFRSRPQSQADRLGKRCRVSIRTFTWRWIMISGGACTRMLHRRFSSMTGGLLIVSTPYTKTKTQRALHYREAIMLLENTMDAFR